MKTSSVAREQSKRLLQSFKIALGSSVAIYIAQMMNLDNAISAGSIALLTIVTTKWETVRLSGYRLITFFLAAIIGCLVFTYIPFEWLSYGIFIFLMCLVCEEFGWKATISVNAVIGMHFLTTPDFDAQFIINELELVVIGISAAIVLNLFYNYNEQQNHLIDSMRYTEEQLQMILCAIAAYLTGKDMERDVWADIEELETDVRNFINDAYEYQENTFASHPGYYIDYFEMRMKQCNTIANLHTEMRRIRRMPHQANIVAEYILYMADYVVEHNEPTKQLERLDELFLWMKEQPLPKTRMEFESRAILYHILMDLEDFLQVKKQFVLDLTPEQRRRYWEKDESDVKLSERIQGMFKRGD